jgi:hypothetical protein
MTSRPTLRPTQSSIQWVPSATRGRGVTLTTPHLVRGQEWVGAIHPLPLHHDCPTSCDNSTTHAVYQHMWIQPTHITWRPVTRWCTRRPVAEVRHLCRPLCCSQGDRYATLLFPAVKILFWPQTAVPSHNVRGSLPRCPRFHPTMPAVPSHDVRGSLPRSPRYFLPQLRAYTPWTTSIKTIRRTVTVSRIRWQNTNFCHFVSCYWDIFPHSASEFPLHSPSTRSISRQSADA